MSDQVEEVMKVMASHIKQFHASNLLSEQAQVTVDFRCFRRKWVPEKPS